MKFSIFVVAILVARASAWWEAGHLLITQIAFNQLEQSDKGLLILRAAQSLSNSMNYLSDKKDQTLIDSSYWIVDVEKQGFVFFQLWKYYDRPLNEDGLYTVLNTIQQGQNLVNAMTRARQILTNLETDKTRKSFKAMFLRMALTYIGDLHAPQHNTNMINDTYQKGDLGGQKEKIILPDGQQMQLDSFLNSGALYLTPYTDFIQRPLNASAQALLQEWAENLVETYPPSFFEEQIKNNNSPFSWSLESYRLSQDFIYPYFKLTNRVTEEFLIECQELVRRRVVLAGYRLAQWLIDNVQL